MIKNKAWTDRLAERLAEVEVAPPADGWQRLEGALSQRAQGSPWMWWRRAGAVAALVALVCGLGVWMFTPKPTAEIVRLAQLPADRLVTLLPQMPMQLDEATLLAVAQPSPARWLENFTENTGCEEVVPDADVVLPERVSQQTEEVAETAAPPTRSEMMAQSSAQTSPAPIQENRAVRVAKPRRGWQVGVSAGSGTSGSLAVQNTENDVLSDRLDSTPEYTDTLLLQPLEPRTVTAPSNLSHELPLSVGVTLSHDLGRGFSLETGVVYTLLRSKYSTLKSSTIQRLHLLGVPLRVHKELYTARNFSLYAGAGGMVEIPVYASLGAVRLHERRVQCSLGAVLGAEYRLGGSAALYLEPECSWYLTETRLETYRTDKPLNLSLRAGLRFRLHNKK